MTRLMYSDATIECARYMSVGHVLSGPLVLPPSRHTDEIVTPVRSRWAPTLTILHLVTTQQPRDRVGIQAT